MKYRTLRLLLLGIGLGWLVAVVGLIMPWPITIEFLQDLGAGTIPQDPMLEYWCRMAAGVFTGIGSLFIMLAHRPDRFGKILGPIAVWMILEGVVLIITGVKNQLPPMPFYPGAALCLAFGIGIGALRNETANKTDGE